MVQKMLLKWKPPIITLLEVPKSTYKIAQIKAMSITGKYIFKF